MFKRLILPAALLLFVSACETESAGPQWVDLPSNLNLGLPQFRQLSESKPQARSEESSPATPAMLASMQVDGEELPAGYEELVASGRLIAHPSQADAGFIGIERIAYGQALGTSKGSFYSNSVRLRLTRDGSQISEMVEDESESCNCLHIFDPWGRTANITIPVAGDCGLTASAYSKHRAKLEWTTGSGKVFTLLTDSDAGVDHTSQPSCPPPHPGGDGGGDPDGEQWYICYWEDYYNLDGSFSHRVDLGCYELNVV